MRGNHNPRAFNTTCNKCRAQIEMRLVRNHKGTTTWHPYNPQTSGQSHLDTCPRAPKHKTGKPILNNDPAHTHVWRLKTQRFNLNGTIDTIRQCTTPGCHTTETLKQPPTPTHT